MNRKTKLPYDAKLVADIRSSMDVSESPVYKSVRKWAREFTKKTGSEKTKIQYAMKLAQFCAWAKMNPDELAARAKAEKSEDDVWAEGLTLDFFDHMEQLGYARTSNVTYYGSIRGFFRTAGILFTKKTPQFKGFAKRKRLDAFPEKVKKMLKAADLRGRFMILGLAQTGLSRDTFASMKYGNVKDDYEHGETRLYWEMVREKSKVWGANFFHREATAAFRMYLEQRKRDGEVVNDETPLLVKNAFGKKGDVVPFTADDVSREIGEIAEIVGEDVSPHMFRKWFKTTCAPIIGDDAVRTMGCWEHPGVGAAYDIPPRDESLKRHLKIESAIAFESEAMDEKERRVQSIVDFAIARGMSIEQAEQLRGMWKANKISPEDAAKEINEILKEKERQPAGGGLSFNQNLSDMLGDILAKAIERAAEKVAK